jgi:hypothetical protein
MLLTHILEVNDWTGAGTPDIPTVKCFVIFFMPYGRM